MENDYKEQTIPSKQTNQQAYDDPFQQSQINIAYETEISTQIIEGEANLKKPKGVKRKQKLQAFRQTLKDPQQRRLRNHEVHQRNRRKLQKQMQNMTNQQKRQYLDNRKHKKKELKQKLKKAVQNEIGQCFLIDNGYESKMTQKQNNSLAKQIQLIVKQIKIIQPSPNVHICSFTGLLKQRLQNNKCHFWPVKYSAQSIDQYIKGQKFKNKNVYYLSPDAKQTLDEIGENDIFIIGGLVDRSIQKYASLNRAQKLGIPARSLPIRPFMKQRTCLNLDHILSIVCKFIQVKDWKTAFDHGAPDRWKNDKQAKSVLSDKISQNNQQKQQTQNVNQKA